MRKLLNWFRRDRLETGLDRELAYHMDRRIADLVESGLTENEARRQATLELSGLTQVREEVRDAWLTRWIREFVYDLRYSARVFRRSPSFTATAVLSLALGIGATTAIYSLVDQVLLRQLPIRDPERLVLIDWPGDQIADGWGSGSLMSYPICHDLQQQTRFFEGVICRAPVPVNLSTGGDHQRTAAELVSGSYFSVLGVRPALGRLFGDEDDQTPGAHPVVVLSYDFWVSQLGGAPDVIGRKVLVNNHPMTVIGVADASFRGVDVGEVPSLWIPIMMKAQTTPSWDRLLDRRARWVHIFARLNPGVTLEQAQAGLQPWFKTMLEEDTRREGFPVVTPERRQRFLAGMITLTPSPRGRSDLRTTMAEPLWVLFAATAVLLGLACLNVAGLFLARGSARDREITTRMALGASRARIGRQFLADCGLIALAGGLLGVLLAPMATRALIAFLPGDDALDLHPTLDMRLLLFAFGVSIAAGVLSGVAPALQAGRASLISSLRTRGGTAFGGVRLRKVIVTAQIAFTLVLVIGAALFVRTLVSLMAKGPGFSTSSLISFSLDPLRSGYSRDEASMLMRRVDLELHSMPNVQSTSVAGIQILNGRSWNGGIVIQTSERFFTDRDTHFNAVSPSFFATLGAKIVAGREFNKYDSRPVGETGGSRSAIVNESFVRRYLRGRNPIGVRIGMGAAPDTKTNIEIVGVVADFNYRGLREENEQAYFPIFEGAGASGYFYIRVRGTPESAFQSIRAIVHNADPTLPISDFRTLDDQVNRSLTTERMLATVSGGFGLLALLLSLVGLYGVMSFVVTQRTREIGVRLALGATRASALWLVLGDAIVMVAAGTAIALPCVWALGRLVASQLYAVKPTDPATIAATSLLLGVVSLAAALIPAYRASTVNPTDALRFE